MRLSYRICRLACQVFTTMYFKARCFGLHRVPASGGTLLVCNHQSFMDPVLVTMALYREGNYMARDTLFADPRFKRLIEFLNAFPVKRNAADIGAIKESLRRLKQGRVLVLFPEGTRSDDGRIGELFPGVGAIAKKARVPIVPTLIDGMTQIWPRDKALPRPGNVVIEYGWPIMPEAYAELSPEGLMALIRERLVAMQHCWHSRVPARRLEWYEPWRCGGNTAEVRSENRGPSKGIAGSNSPRLTDGTPGSEQRP
ncbi:MAG TPA: lysophospholipid acyltransferase family protein [Phycisphaerae bacterium]|nr:lysophospholipid acyltransferase family protein [Phycisphaerae bacterium]